MSSHFQPYTANMPWEKAYGYTQAIKAGSTLYISGQLAVDEQGNFLGEGDITLQTQATFANIDRILEAYGARREDVVQTTLLIKDLRRHFEVVGRFQAEYFGNHRPTCTTFGVVDLVLPQQLLEISAIAVLPE